jgi:5'-deoxynucleotidase YfbR-like HD superfamily hydrolase
MSNESKESPYLRIMKLGRRLDNIPRFSNQSRIKDETVAAHSYNVALMVFLMASEMVELGYLVDVGECIKEALLHDFPEAITGDIIYPVKKHDKGHMNILGALEDEMMAEAIPDTLPRYLRNLFIPTTAFENSDEGLLVKFCDMCELVLHAVSERRLGNQYFNEFICKGLWYCYEMIYAEEILRRSPMVKDMIMGLAVESHDFTEIDLEVVDVLCHLEGIRWNV